MTSETPDLDAAIARVLELDKEATVERWQGVVLEGSTTNELVSTKDEMIAYVTRCINAGARDDFWFVLADEADVPADVCHTGNGPRSPVNAALIAEYRTLAPLLARALQEMMERKRARRVGLAIAERVGDGEEVTQETVAQILNPKEAPDG